MFAGGGGGKFALIFMDKLTRNQLCQLPTPLHPGKDVAHFTCLVKYASFEIYKYMCFMFS